MVGVLSAVVTQSVRIGLLSMTLEVRSVMLEVSIEPAKHINAHSIRLIKRNPRGQHSSTDRNLDYKMSLCHKNRSPIRLGPKFADRILGSYHF
jgi:hypothetical protein